MSFIEETGEGANASGLSWCWILRRRRLSPDDLLFEEGDIYCRLSSKYLPLDHRGECLHDDRERFRSFSCGIAGCSLNFDSLLKYESHYNLIHRHVCSTCKRIFPSSHLLDIHILESHDVMFSILTTKKAMFQCLVESCSENFKSAKERKSHMIKVHHYPANYRFDSSTKTKRVPVKNKKKCTFDTENVIPMETEMGTHTHIEASQNSSGRKFSYKVPDNFCFGQGTSKAFHGTGKSKRSRKKKQWYNIESLDKDTSVKIENVNMMDLQNSLP